MKETMQRVGSDIKNKLVDSVKNTWNTMTQYTMFSRPEPPPTQPTIEQQVTKALEAHLGPAQVDPPSETESESGDQPTDVALGCLNGGRRVDYVYRGSGVSPDSVLMGSEVARDRSPIKLLSDQFLPSPSPPKSQLFSSLRFPSSASLSSDGTGEGVSRSQSIPKLDKEASPTLLSTSSPPDLQLQGGLPSMGMDPTAPMGEAKNLAPPPMGGFVKQALQRK
ncbi:hypothetical protein J437_LFUL017111 [Ladona fulva]|uniref:Uncharacterized protein n=1 Tax=Ladona fulva TaxID=123851 RepID=A0A8K0P5S9_LADFU|nr:hypothetical protein J437_LFUL017111 [Ladona fulva]